MDKKSKNTIQKTKTFFLQEDFWNQIVNGFQQEKQKQESRRQKQPSFLHQKQITRLRAVSNILMPILWQNKLLFNSTKIIFEQQRGKVLSKTKNQFYQQMRKIKQIDQYADQQLDQIQSDKKRGISPLKILRIINLISSFYSAYKKFKQLSKDIQGLKQSYDLNDSAEIGMLFDDITKLLEDYKRPFAEAVSTFLTPTIRQIHGLYLNKLEFLYDKVIWYIIRQITIGNSLFDIGLTVAGLAAGAFSYGTATAALYLFRAGNTMRKFVRATLKISKAFKAINKATKTIKSNKWAKAALKGTYSAAMTSYVIYDILDVTKEDAQNYKAYFRKRGVLLKQKYASKYIERMKNYGQMLDKTSQAFNLFLDEGQNRFQSTFENKFDTKKFFYVGDIKFQYDQKALTNFTEFKKLISESLPKVILNSSSEHLEPKLQSLKDKTQDFNKVLNQISKLLKPSRFEESKDIQKIKYNKFTTNYKLYQNSLNLIAVGGAITGFYLNAIKNGKKESLRYYFDEQTLKKYFIFDHTLFEAQYTVNFSGESPVKVKKSKPYVLLKHLLLNEELKQQKKISESILSILDQFTLSLHYKAIEELKSIKTKMIVVKRTTRGKKLYVPSFYGQQGVSRFDEKSTTITSKQLGDYEKNVYIPNGTKNEISNEMDKALRQYNQLIKNKYQSNFRHWKSYQKDGYEVEELVILQEQNFEPSTDMISKIKSMSEDSVKKLRAEINQIQSKIKNSKQQRNIIQSIEKLQSNIMNNGYK